MDLDELDEWMERTAEACGRSAAAFVLRAEDRRQLHRPYLRGRRARAGGHPRRRHHRRGRDREHAHGAATCPCACARRRAGVHRRRGWRRWSCAARCICRRTASSALNAAAEEDGPRPLREPAQRCCRVASPEGCGRDEDARPLYLYVRHRRRRRLGGGGPVGASAVAAEGRLPREPGRAAVHHRRGSARLLPRAPGAPRVAALRDRRRGGEGERLRPASAPWASRPGRRAGPSRSSSRPRRRRRFCATSPCRWDAPARSRRWPSWCPWWWPAPRWPARRCTT